MKRIETRYYTNKELQAAGYRSSDIKDMVEHDNLLKIKFGLYRSNLMYNNHQNFIDISVAAPKSIVAGLSALHYYKLTTFIPQKVYIAVLRGDNLPRLIYPPIEAIFISEKYFDVYVETLKENDYSFRIYNMEKAICDAFKYKNKIGIDIAKEVLKEYIKQPKRDISKLLKIAEYCKVKKQ